MKTIKDMAGKLRIGEMVLDQPTLSVLTRIGIQAGWCRVVRKENRGRGKPTSYFDIDWPLQLGVQSVTQDKP